MTIVPWLEPQGVAFPPPDQALDEPPGLLAAGGDLTPARLLEAYRLGIFPWYEAGSPILWWSPDPRAVIRPDALHVPRSLRRRLNKTDYSITADTAFKAVISGCAEWRADHAGTWITPEMQRAYEQLHVLGYAHSIEVWMPKQGTLALAGGIYGLALGHAFFGESMFTLWGEASKIAFVHLLRQLEAWGFELVDAQLPSDHLARLGVTELARSKFLTALRHCLQAPTHRGPWQLSWDWRRTDRHPHRGKPYR